MTLLAALSAGHAQESTEQALPEAQLLHHIDLSEHAPAEDFFRTSAQFGDLNNDGVHRDFIRYANSKRMQAFAYGGEDSMELLWEHTGPEGLPDPPERYHYKYTVWDVDGDGRTEVVGPFATDAGMIELRILDGESGEVKRSVETTMPNPESDDDVDEWRVKVTVANFRGLETPQDIVMLTENDSDGDIFVYDDQLNLLWDTTGDNEEKEKIYAHYPWTGDLDGDSRDELVGTRVFDDDGTKLWRITPPEWGAEDVYYDHVGRAFIGDLDPNRAGLELLVSFEYLHARLYDAEGNVMWSHRDEDVANENDDAKDAKINSVGHYTDRWEGVTLVVEDPLIKDEDDEENDRRAIFNVSGERVMEIPAVRDGYPFDWDGDRSLDEQFSPRRAQVYAPVQGGELRLESDYEDHALTPYAEDEDMRIYAHALDITGDYREEVVILDEDEMMVFGAQGEAPADHPSPWEDPQYRLMIANMMNDNHPERMYFDWRALDAGLTEAQ